jgi:hypothetical protein
MSTFTEVQHQELMHECMEYEMGLNEWKEKISELRDELYAFAAGKVNTEIKIGIEHFHNQFHIQQINIHDLIHEINSLINQANEHPEFRFKDQHHEIKTKFDSLIKSLRDIESEFKSFTK